MAVLETLGFIATYEVLKHYSSKAVAATICVVLMSAPIFFQQTTQVVNPGMPVLFATMAAVWVSLKYDKARTRVPILGWGLILTLTVILSLMFASATVALLGAMLAVLVATFFSDQRRARIRAQKLLPVLLAGLIVQGLWMHRKPAPLEWPQLPGYPAPYLQQLKVKSGNYPELGIATLGDVLVRIESNSLKQMDLLAQLVLRHGVDTSKVAVAIAPLVPIGIGWGYSLWETGGESLLAWYFAGYEFIYLLWPWGVERRFFLPVAPLACLFLWKGVKASVILVKSKPRLVGLLWAPFGLLLGVSGCHWLYIHRLDSWGSFPDELLVPVWLFSSFGAAWMAYTGRPPSILLSSSEFARWLFRPITFVKVSPWRVSQASLGVLFLTLIAAGLTAEAKMARDNVAILDLLSDKDTSINLMAPDIESALWIRSHTPGGSVVMARHVPLVYHYSERRIVWFAPISNPDILMQGIVRHGVNYVIVVKHAYTYYLPDDNYCFDKLLAKYGDAFHLVFRDSSIRIFEVQSNDRSGTELKQPSVQ
jgi:hypothetical protein